MLVFVLPNLNNFLAVGNVHRGNNLHSLKKWNTVSHPPQISPLWLPSAPTNKVISWWFLFEDDFGLHFAHSFSLYAYLKYLCLQISYGINWKLVVLFYFLLYIFCNWTVHHFLFAWTFFSEQKLRTCFLRRLSITDPSRSGPRVRSSMLSSTLDPATSGCPPSSAPSGSSPAVRIFVTGVLSSPTSLRYTVEWRNSFERT